jgi:hypothetical protein
MSILTIEKPSIRAQRVVITNDTISVDLLDGRTISAPLAWYPRLFYGKIAERNNWRWIGDREGIHWPELDEDISIEGLLLGKRSGESQRSFKKWLDKRIARTPKRHDRRNHLHRR